MRTALVLVGTGTAGAYHAGVLRALREGGVRVDVVAGRGIGVASAIFAAADADARLWDAKGLWSHLVWPHRLYSWRWRWLWLTVGLGLALAALTLPLVAAVALACLYPLVYGALLVAPSAGAALALWYADTVAWLLSPEVLLGLVPRVVTALLLVAATGAMVVVSTVARDRGGARRHRGRAWWHALGAPLEARRLVAWITEGFWRYLRGAANIPEPRPEDLSQRYVELLRENVRQPGYRELILSVHDLDARCDLVFAWLAEPFRTAFMSGDDWRGRRDHEVHDLDGLARVHLVDALAGAVALVPACEPHLIRFSPDSIWRGEAHRIADRPAAIGRLLEEVHRAGARQVVLVLADAPGAGPHALTASRADPRARIGEVIAAEEAAAARDAVAAFGRRFDGCFVIRPGHNPLGPLDFGGTYDEASDRRFHLVELMARGYEDAHRQFIEPVVGASGDALAARPPAAASL